MLNFPLSEKTKATNLHLGHCRDWGYENTFVVNGNLIFHAGPYGTSFEIEGMHGWELCASNTKSQWYVRSGQTGTENTGPNGDHTKEGAGMRQ